MKDIRDWVGFIKTNCIKCGASLENNIYACALKRYWYLCKQCYNNRASKNNDMSIKRYKCSEKGKCAKHKENAKRRNLKWIPMFPNPFDESEKIEWHHISDEFVIAIPADLHRLYAGNDIGHRELCMNIINQIYM